MKTASDTLKLIAWFFLAVVLILTAILLSQTLQPALEPSTNGVSRLVDEQYNVLCYYSRFAMSCLPLHP